MQKKPKGLGRGLGSLIPNKIKNTSNQTTQQEPIYDENNRLLEINVEAISANPYQPRYDFDDDVLDDLVESIKEHGVLQPLIVSLVPGNDQAYELIAGERRLRASKKAGLVTVPVIVRNVTNQEKLELAIIENIQRQDLNPIEEAIAYKQLMDEYDMTQEAVSEKLGKSRSVIANSLRLLNLADEIKHALQVGALSSGHARAILGLPTSEQQMALFNKIKNLSLTVRDTEEEVKKVSVKTHVRKVGVDPFMKELQESLQSFLGTRVNIRPGKKGGQIMIDYYSGEELPSLIRRITREEVL